MPLFWRSMAIHAIRKRIRVLSRDSAFVYFILESHEGITSYSTLPFNHGDRYRDLELLIPPDFLDETEALLAELERSIKIELLAG